MAEKVQVKVSVVRQDRKHFAIRTFPQNFNTVFPGLVFEVTDDIDAFSADGVDALNERVKQEARRRGILHVLNLD